MRNIKELFFALPLIVILMAGCIGFKGGMEDQTGGGTASDEGEYTDFAAKSAVETPKEMRAPAAGAASGSVEIDLKQGKLPQPLKTPVAEEGATITSVEPALSSSSSRTATVDREVSPGGNRLGGGTASFLIVSATPAASSTDVPTSSSIDVTFSRPIDTASLSADSMRVMDSAGRPVDGNVNVSDDTMTFAPTRELNVLTRYEVVLSGDVRDTEGRTLGAEQRWSFDTRDGRWGETYNVVSNVQEMLHGFDPALYLDNDGNADLIYAKKDGSIDNIYDSTFVAGIVRGSPQSVEDSPRKVRSWPILHMDPFGTKWVIWISMDDFGSMPTYGISLSERTADRRWLAVPIHTTVREIQYANMAINRSGRGVIAWCEKVGENCNIYTRMFDPVRGWDRLPTMVEDVTGDNRQIQAAVDGAGNIFLIWTFVARDPNPQRIYVKQHIYGRGWLATRALDIGDSGNRMDLPQITVDNAGNAIAIWRSVNLLLGTSNIRYSIYRAGTGWDTPSILRAATLIEGALKLAGDGNGNAVAVWMEPGSVSLTHNLYFNHYTAGRGWDGTSVFLARDYAGNPGDFDVYMNDSGNGMVVWTGSNFPNYYLSAARIRELNLEPAVTVDTSDRVLRSPVVTMNERSQAFVVWQQDSLSPESYNILSKYFE